MAQTKQVTKRKPNIAKSRSRGSRKTETLDDPISELNVESAEEIAKDNEEWDAIIANTPPEKMARLKQMFNEQLERGGFTLLDFTEK